MRPAAAAVLLTLLAGVQGCCGCASNATFERRAAPAIPPGPAAPLAPPVVRALHFGDFGDPNCQQVAIAAAVAARQRREPFDLALHAGDNLYECGPDARAAGAASCAFSPDGNTVTAGAAPPDDPSFREKFEEPLAALAAAGVPTYLALGNHDVATWGACLSVGDPSTIARTKACLEVAHESPAWRMPGRHYVVDRGTARFIVLDTNLVGGDYGGFTLADEIAFLRASAVDCDARACFVLAHHPAATAGEHRSDFDAAFTARMEELVAAGGGRLRGWLAGHDHDLQHLRTAAGLDVFVSGNGARARPGERFERAAPAGATLLYGSVRWGLAVLEVSSAGFRWRAEDAQGAPRYCCEATRAPPPGGWSPCEPVGCE